MFISYLSLGNNGFTPYSSKPNTARSRHRFPGLAFLAALFYISQGLENRMPMSPNRTPDKLSSRETKPFSRGERLLSKILLGAENLVKVPLFRCQRCGECILSHTAFICSQRCPKRMRNGPCGGTGEGGTCEVDPKRKCIWHAIYKRALFFRRVGMLSRLEKIHNWDLEKTSSWLNVARKRIESPEFFYRDRENK